MSNKKKEKVNLNRDQIFTHLDEELDSALNELADKNEFIDSILNEEDMGDVSEVEPAAEIEDEKAAEPQALSEEEENTEESSEN